MKLNALYKKAFGESETIPKNCVTVVAMHGNRLSNRYTKFKKYCRFRFFHLLNFTSKLDRQNFFKFAISITRTVRKCLRKLKNAGHIKVFSSLSTLNTNYPPF